MGVGGREVGVGGREVGGRGRGGYGGRGGAGGAGGGLGRVHGLVLTAGDHFLDFLATVATAHLDLFRTVHTHTKVNEHPQREP